MEKVVKNIKKVKKRKKVPKKIRSCNNFSYIFRIIIIYTIFF